ncbi:collagen alpha-1(I) chain-like isoform X2 [Cygnus olor]|uniref:collagen alpha-1(I) chain-like isoform X2 n=1 Tax=Cygnus olor TaxID=8869 RepID=UPI001ADE0398|nr:collagen alpha-1(I) chain-like isoform X2 [Cygnus olor]
MLQLLRSLYQYCSPRGLAATARRPGAGPCPSGAAAETSLGCHGCWGGTRRRSSLSSLPAGPPLPRGGGDSRRSYRGRGAGLGAGEAAGEPGPAAGPPPAVPCPGSARGCEPGAERGRGRPAPPPGPRGLRTCPASLRLTQENTASTGDDRRRLERLEVSCTLPATCLSRTGPGSSIE